MKHPVYTELVISSQRRNAHKRLKSSGHGQYIRRERMSVLMTLACDFADTGRVGMEPRMYELFVKLTKSYVDRRTSCLART